jgi:DnaJ-like protein
MLEMLIGKAIGQAVRAVQTQDPLLIELQTWFGVLLDHAPGRWRAVVHSHIGCGMPDCPRPAVGACVVCRMPTCLGHGMVSADAAVACVRCVHVAASNGKRWTPQTAGLDPEVVRKKHLKVLGLKEGATLDEIKSAFRTLAAKHHPDRQRTDGAKKKSTEKMAQLSESYHWLIENTKKSEAA